MADWLGTGTGDTGLGGLRSLWFWSSKAEFRLRQPGPYVPGTHFQRRGMWEGLRWGGEQREGKNSERGGKLEGGGESTRGGTQGKGDQ